MSFLWLSLDCCVHLHWWQRLHEMFQMEIGGAWGLLGWEKVAARGLSPVPCCLLDGFSPVPRCPIMPWSLLAVARPSALPTAAPGAVLHPRLGCELCMKPIFLCISHCFLFPHRPTFFFFPFFPPLFFLWEVFQRSSGFSDALPNRPLVTSLAASYCTEKQHLPVYCVTLSTRWSYLSWPAK